MSRNMRARTARARGDARAHAPTRRARDCSISYQLGSRGAPGFCTRVGVATHGLGQERRTLRREIEACSFGRKEGGGEGGCAPKEIYLNMPRCVGVNR